MLQRREIDRGDVRGDDRNHDMIPREIMKCRIQSEEDDRFRSSDRESSSKINGDLTMPQLNRSVSVASQHETRLSSDDNGRQLDQHPQQHHHSSTSKEIITGEAKKEDRRLQRSLQKLPESQGR